MTKIEKLREEVEIVRLENELELLKAARKVKMHTLGDFDIRNIIEALRKLCASRKDGMCKIHLYDDFTGRVVSGGADGDVICRFGSGEDGSHLIREILKAAE